jgi:hypothetical protein
MTEDSVLSQRRKEQHYQRSSVFIRGFRNDRGLTRRWRIEAMRTLLVGLTMFLLALPVHAKYSGGTGEPNDPYQIATAADLIALGETPEDYDKHFILTADIDLDPNLPGRKVFDRAIISPDTKDIEDGFQGTSFAGVFDGNGHTILHLTITGNAYLGLFGQLGGQVENVGIVDVNIAGLGICIGGLVGHIGTGTISACYSTGAVSGNTSIGGLVGQNGEEIWIEGRGGRFMKRVGGRMANCYSTCSVTGTATLGGLVGYNYAGTITTCYSTGRVSGNDQVGGLVGSRLDGTEDECFWDIQTTGQVTSWGGVGKTTAEMYTASTYFLWSVCGNEGIWTIDDGLDYPHLAWEHRPGVILSAHLSDFLVGSGSEDNPYLIYTPNDIEIIASFACEQGKHFRLMFVEGQGTQDSPYLIYTAEQLNMIGMLQNELDKHFKLMADIDLSIYDGRDGRCVFNKIGTNYDNTFTGVFDGNGMSILNISSTIFASVHGTIQDVRFTEPNSTGSPVASNYGTIARCCVQGGRVSGAGGLVGQNHGTVTHCYSTTSGAFTGGLVGRNFGDVTYCYSAGKVKGNTAGGVVGDCPLMFATVQCCVWDMETSGASQSAGGVGLTTAEMMDPNMLGLNGFANDPNWVLNAGLDYPRLTWEGTQGVTIPEPVIYWLAGQGTQESPYMIDTADQLILMGKASILWDKHFVLGADINLDPNLSDGHIFGQAVIPTFTGVFDGNSHIISNLVIEGVRYLGLFSRLESGAEVKNLGVVDVNVIGSSSYVGGLVGENSYGHVDGCYGTGTVSGGRYVGGLVGENYGIITNCYSKGTFTGDFDVGGLVGGNNGSITASYSTSAVSGDGDVGGLIGYTYKGAVTECYSTGSVSGDVCVGGLVGSAPDCAITHCYSAGEVNGSAFVGGLVGSPSPPRVTASFWDTETSGQTTRSWGTGKTTAEMQTASTFLDAGWDFVGETANGTADIWKIADGLDYPRLWWETTEE